jgi:hypothetical protein
MRAGRLSLTYLPSLARALRRADELADASRVRGLFRRANGVHVVREQWLHLYTGMLQLVGQERASAARVVSR